jgi:putative FmdB family regulatory protein
MAAYDYRCNSCQNLFEIHHGMNDSPLVKCPKCNSESVRVPHVVGFSTHSIKTESMKKAVSQVQRNLEMKETLKREVGIEKIKPIGNQSMEQIYRDTMAQKSQIKEEMMASREKSEKVTKEKQKEWMKKALERTPQRSRERAEHKAADAAKKRAIKI